MRIRYLKDFDHDDIGKCVRGESANVVQEVAEELIAIKYAEPVRQAKQEESEDD